MNITKTKAGILGVIGLIGASLAGVSSLHAAVIEAEYDFEFEHSFGTRTYNVSTFPDPVNFTENNSFVVSIDPFNTSLGTLDSVDISFSTGVYTYQITLATTRTTWSWVSITKQLEVISLDPLITFENASASDTFTASSRTSLNENISGAPVNFSQSITDSAALEAFLGSTPYQLQINSTDVFAMNNERRLPTGSSFTASVAAAGLYSGTVSVAYNYTAVPEPSVLALLVLAGVAAVVYVRRARSVVR